MQQSLNKKTKIKIADCIPQNKCFDYLRPKGEVIMKKDNDFDALSLQIKGDCWVTAQGRLASSQKC